MTDASRFIQIIRVFDLYAESIDGEKSEVRFSTSLKQVLIFTALQGMRRGLAMRILALYVRLSVCQTRAL